MKKFFPRKKKDDRAKPMTLFAPYGSFVRHIWFREKVAWVLILVLIGVIVIQYTISSLTPHNVVIVDENGRILGELSGSERSDEEVRLDVIRFVQHFTSANAGTIEDDLVIWLNVLKAEAREEQLNALEEGNYLARLKEAGTVSSTVIDSVDFIVFGTRDVTLPIDKKKHWAVRVRGTVRPHTANIAENLPFDYYMTFAVVAYNQYNPLGIIEVDIYPYKVYEDTEAAR